MKCAIIVSCLGFDPMYINTIPDAIRWSMPILDQCALFNIHCILATFVVILTILLHLSARIGFDPVYCHTIPHLIRCCMQIQNSVGLYPAEFNAVYVVLHHLPLFVLITIRVRPQPNRVGFYPVYLNTVPFALRNLQLSIFYKCAFNPNSYAHTWYCSYFCIIVLMQAFVQLLQLFILIITIRVRPQPNRVRFYPVYFNTVPFINLLQMRIQSEYICSYSLLFLLLHNGTNAINSITLLFIRLQIQVRQN